MKRRFSRRAKGGGYFYSEELSTLIRNQLGGEPPLRGVGPFWRDKTLREGRVDHRRGGLSMYRQFRDAPE